MDEVVPCSFALALAIVVGRVYVLVLAEDGHTASMSNEAVVEQVHLDEADAQSDTGFGASLLSQRVALNPGFWFHLMTELLAEAVEELKNLHCFQSPASRQELHVPPSQRCHHFRKCEDQYEGFLSPLGRAILLVKFHVAFAASAEYGVLVVVPAAVVV